MQVVHYAGGSFVTGDAIAEAVMTYAASLANDDRASYLKVPAVDGGGFAFEAKLLIGPASQLVALRHVQEPELEDREFVDRTLAEARRRVVSAGIDPSPLLD